MGSIDANTTTINFNDANIRIVTSGKGLIFADGTTLSSNTEIGGGGTANLAQVVNLGNATSNTMILENTDKTIVSSGNIESNIITTIIRFQEGSELPDGQGITLENAANNGNTISNVVTFSNGLVATSISGLDTLSFTSTNTTTPPLQLTASSLNDGVGALRIDSVEPDIYLNDTNGGFATVTFADNDVQRCAFGRNSGNDFYLTVRDPSTNSGNWRNDTFVADSSTGDISMGYNLTVSNVLSIGEPLSNSGFLISQGYANLSMYGYMYTQAILNSTQRGYGPAGIVFGNGATYGSNEMSLLTDGNTVMYLSESSNVGIGTTSPSANLHVVGNVHATGNIESNIVTSAIYFGNGTYTAEVASSNLENVTSRGADTTSQINFKGGFVVESNLSADVYGDLTTNTISTNDIVVSTSEKSSIISTGIVTIEADSKTYTVHSNTFNADITGFTVNNLINGGQVVLNLYNTDSSSHDVSPGSGKLTSFSGTLTVPSANNAIFTITKINSNIFVNGGIFN